jgi:predicted amidohydrolase YtcJ
MKFRSCDAIFYNGRIVTLSENKVVRAVAVSDGRIVAAGTDAKVKDAAPRGCDKYDLGGKLVLPGFIDAHTHFIQMGVDALSVDLSSSRSLDEAMSMMKAGAKKVSPGEWVVGSGWRESKWSDGRFITRDDLDSACPDNPSVAHRICGHLSSVSSSAIDQIPITTEMPDVMVDSGGRLTGVVTESSVAVVRNATAPTQEKRMKGLAVACRKAHSLGVTSVQDNGDAEDLPVYIDASNSGKLSVRVYYNTPSAELDSRLRIGIPTPFGSEWLKVGGVKIFCDGALGARTAALSEPFTDDPGNSGMLIHTEDELREMASKANEAGIQLAIHAIGDRGIEVALSAMENSLDEHPRRNHRHRIEHLELPTPSHVDRMRRRKIIASMQPNFVGEWSGINGMYYERLGAERAKGNNPFKQILRSKVKLVFGSDCMPFSPVYGLASAVTAPHEVQRLTVEEAVAAYTRDAAFTSFEENLKGVIAEGMLADFVVLSRNPFVETGDIRDIQVVKTVVGGDVVYDRMTAKGR